MAHRPASQSSKDSVDDANSPAIDRKDPVEVLEKPGASLSEYSVFDDPILAPLYMPPDNYESKHRFDINATWTDAEERAIIRKCDLRVALFACVCFVALQLDRNNITNANSDNFLADLKLSTNDYNLGQTIFYITFLFAELPSQLISKKLDIILYLSYFYKSAELPIRLSFFWMTLTATNIVGNLMAAGILQMRGLHGWAGWRYLFLIEGCITFAIGAFAALWFPPSPTQTSGGIRGKGWFSEREETIIVTRVLRDDPTKSDMHNRQGISLLALWRSFKDFDHWPLYALGITTYIAPGTVNAYFTLILKGFGFSTFHTNLLIIPSNVIFILNNFLLTSLSTVVKERAFVASIGSWWQLILLSALVAVPNAGAWAKYAIFTLLLGYPYAHPILVSWNSNNSGSVRTRSVSASLYNIAVQLGSIISSNIYQAKDKPSYSHGNRVLIGIVAANIVLFFFAKAWFIFRNKQKAAIWDSWTPEERANYVATTTDLGNKRVDFRFEH
ncbi:hypothetical protein MNV49_004194 [Pseudohyphozyma bogoriensis]|nr:hypothetical protein MNV49_004194 [Pseudohyphozyma bogoriensis]